MTPAQLSWALRAGWHQGSLRTGLAVSALALSAGACMLAGAWYRSTQREESALQAQWARSAGTALPVTATDENPGRDFTASLGAVQASEHLVAVIQSAAARARVTLASVQVQEQATTPDRLGRTELPLVLRGRYPAIKRCLAEILDRIPHTTVARLQWQRVEGVAESEARVQLVAWFAPAAAAATSPARP